MRGNILICLVALFLSGCVKQEIPCKYVEEMHQVALDAIEKCQNTSTCTLTAADFIALENMKNTVDRCHKRNGL